MADEKALAILRRGVEAWNQWRLDRPYGDQPADLSEARLWEADLRSSNLSGMDLSGANLNVVDLSEANLSGAYLSDADLSAADLRRAVLSEASLGSADLGSANLSEANLSNAGLSCADLSGANLSGANLFFTNFNLANLADAIFTSASCSQTIFASVDLSNTKGLKSVRHHSPSTIGLDTLYLSGGRIPDSFLRGCGVPDTFISYAASLVVKPFEFYSCFISYSHKDEQFAKRLHSRMQAEHLRVWYSPANVEGGKKLHEQIDAAIRRYDKLLLLLSPNSMASEWVKTEVHKARQRELKEERRVLFPISLVPFEQIRAWEFFDADTGKDLAREIREYFIPDFSNWKHHDTFEKAFGHLLRDLQANAAKKD